MSVSIEQIGNALNPRKPVSLFHTQLWGGGGNAVTNQQYAVSHDDRFLMNINADTAATPPITLLLNWKPTKK